MSRTSILAEINQHRDTQDAQHGAQKGLPVVRGEHYLEAESVMRSRYEDRKRKGVLAHADIILEELAEALDATTPAAMREELVQAAACIVKAIEALDWQHGNG